MELVNCKFCKLLILNKFKNFNRIIKFNYPTTTTTTMKLNYFQSKYYINNFNDIIFNTIQEEHNTYENLNLIKNILKNISVNNNITIGTKTSDDIVLDNFSEKELQELNLLFDIMFPYITLFYETKITINADGVSMNCSFKFD